MDLDEVYIREVPVSWLVLVPTLLLSFLGTLPVLLFSLLRGTSTTGADARSFKQLRKGPEIPVLPVWLRGDDGSVIELEIHGYMRSDRLLLKDHVRVERRRQRRADLPDRAYRIHNHTTGQTITPHPHTVLSHLGLAMILRAGIGAVLAALMIVAWFAGG